MEQYAHGQYSPQYSATVAMDFTVKEEVVDDTMVRLQIWDTAGQEKYQSVQSVYYKGTDGCILVFDLTNPDSFQTLNKWKDEFLAFAEPGAAGFPFVLIGNKKDLEKERAVILFYHRSQLIFVVAFVLRNSNNSNFNT